jgi:hypothetical protein
VTKVLPPDRRLKTIGRTGLQGYRVSEWLGNQRAQTLLCRHCPQPRLRCPAADMRARVHMSAQGRTVPQPDRAAAQP